MKTCNKPNHLAEEGCNSLGQAWDVGRRRASGIPHYLQPPACWMHGPVLPVSIQRMVLGMAYLSLKRDSPNLSC